MGKITLTWNATANVCVEWKGQRIFFDPWFHRIEKSDPKIKNTIDFVNEGPIFMSHGHFDHLQDVPTILAKKAGVTVYCSEIAKKTIDTQLHLRKEIDPSQIQATLDRVHVIHGGDVVQLEKQGITVNVIPSKHVVFDFRTVMRVLFNPEVWKNSKIARGLLKDYPAGDVFGFDVHFGNDARIVMFGSLWEKFPEILKQHANPDIYIAPVAGRLDAGKIALKIVDLLKPRIVIPVHHDNFYPPITYWVPLDALKAGLKSRDPPVKFIELDYERPTEIETG
nr:MBL fold metallo-hydrolase [Candidatus Sigynarchaeota archaeon]